MPFPNWVGVIGHKLSSFRACHCLHNPDKVIKHTSSTRALGLHTSVRCSKAEKQLLLLTSKTPVEVLPSSSGSERQRVYNAAYHHRQRAPNRSHPLSMPERMPQTERPSFDPFRMPTFDPFLNSVNSLPEPPSTEHPAKRQRTAAYPTAPEAVKLAVGLLEEEGTRIPFPGLFLYTPEMPAILLTNICTALGQVNGARGIASGIVVDPTGMSFYC
ncbi:hypothetical protein B0O99DRAFT_49905 [Bisporella sp. PMI_857]|nr:hypothetical protein B0O99DRAFT_49905 [Bisporella sp. PMI_857]